MTLIEKLKKYDWQLISILLVTAFLHFSLLNVRPPHHDEGVFGFFVDQIRERGFYKYDPTNYHGPLHYYIMFISQTIFGRSIVSLRLPDVLISILSVYWLALFSPFVGRRAALISALAMALSPGLIYFGGFAFQEAFQVFYTILILWGLLGLWHEGTKKYLWAIGIGFTLNFLTKETYIIHIGCFILAWIALVIFEKFSPSAPFQIAKQKWTNKDLFWVIIAFFALVIFFYSGTFLNFTKQALTDLLQPYTAWYKTGFKGGGHDKPFIYWANLMLRYEQISLLGFLACLKYLRPLSNRWIRYIAIYGIGVFLAYSIIPYKTTWCIINMLWPFYFVFGYTVDKLIETKFKVLVSGVTVTLFIISAIIACKLNYIDNTNAKEPYVYVQTYNEYKKATDPLFKLVKQDPSKYRITGNALLSSYWPIPWILNDFTMIGYYGMDISPANYDADFLLVEQARINEAEENLQNQYFTDSLRIHSAQNPSKVYFNSETFKDIFTGRIPDFMSLKPGEGLLAIYYPGNAEWKGMPLKKSQAGRIDFYVDERSTPLPPPFSVELVGEINVPSSNVTLILYSDDGGYVEIDGKRVIEDLGSHGEHAQAAVIKNMQGWRKIKIGGYDVWGYYVLRLKWVDANGSEVSVPVSALRFNEALLKS